MNIIVQKGRYTLLDVGNKYIVAAGYNGETWDQGYYFEYNEYNEDKVKALYRAVDFFRGISEYDFIRRMRLEELATKFKDGMFEADCEYAEEFIETEMDLTHTEKEWLGIEEEY